MVFFWISQDTLLCRTRHAMWAGTRGPSESHYPACSLCRLYTMHISLLSKGRQETSEEGDDTLSPSFVHVLIFTAMAAGMSRRSGSCPPPCARVSFRCMGMLPWATAVGRPHRGGSGVVT
jgi:hypothetical protein